MAPSARLDPALEARVDQEAKRLGMTKPDFVEDALERVLWVKNPHTLLNEVRSRKPVGDPTASENVSGKMKANFEGVAWRWAVGLAVRQ